MTKADLRIDPLTGAHVVVTPWRQQRPNLPQGPCPFCPGGLEAPGPYDVRHFANRWPALPDGRHEVVLHSPDHDASFPALGDDQAARVVELWSARTAALGSRDDVAYVFVFENRGRAIGATIDHPHSQIMAFGAIPPIPEYELSAGKCDFCQDPTTTCWSSAARAGRRPCRGRPRGRTSCSSPRPVTWPTCPPAGPELRAALGAMLVDALTRVERSSGPARPTCCGSTSGPADGDDWPAAHLHLHLAPALRAPGVRRHLAAAEFGAGVFFDPVDPRQAAARLRSASA